MIMKQKILAVSVAAALTGGFAGSASAVLSVVENGVGHALIVPYFTTQGGNATLLNIINTDTTNGKAVKVRFRSGVDSDDIFDFQVFLSPGDVWTANVSQDATSGLSKLSTADRSCTLPASVNQSFITARLASYTDANGAVHTVAEQTREGYVEIFNMADIPKFLSTTAGGYVASTNVNPLYTAIKHTGTTPTPPCTSATLLGIEAVGGAVISPAVAIAPAAVGSANYSATQQVFPPTGTLMGNWTIVNIPRTLAFSGGMPAIQASGGTTMVVYSGQSGTSRAASHSRINDASATALTFPTLNMTEDGVLLNQAQTGVITADYDFPDMSTPYEANAGANADPGSQALALSLAIARQAVINEFSSDSTISAGTDWVMSLPTRRYHVAGRHTDYGSAGDLKGYPVTESINSIAAAGIAGGVTGQFAGVVSYTAGGRSACVSTGSSPAYFDREETAAVGGGAVISPGSPTTYSLCGEVNVLSWNNSGATSTTLLSTLIMANSSAGTVTNGWAKADLGVGAATLPVLGDAFAKAINQNVTPAVYFGATWKHRYQ